MKPCKDDNEVWHESDRKDMKWFCFIVVIDLIKQWGEAIASPLFFCALSDYFIVLFLF